MKRPLTIAATATLAMLILYACASTIRTGTTSFVTVTIGGPANTAVLKAEAATPWARFKYFLADVKLMPEAYAYIPSIVQAIIVTVTAPDITTPIVGVSNLSSNQTIAQIRIEVPNGAARKFTIEGIHGVTSLVTYRSSTEADLDGTDVTLPITMQFNFFGSAIFVDSALGNDTIYSGLTYTRPFRTISRALSLQSSSTPYNTIPVIWVEFGDYLPVGAGGSETFPLQLNPGTALICGGRGFSTVIGAIGGGIKVRGNDGASIDNCKIVVNTNGSVGVDDSKGGGPSPVPTTTKINGSLIEIIGGPTAIMTGVVLSGNSTLLESSVTGSSLGVSTVTGVAIRAGSPSILSSKIASLVTGLTISTTGTPVIDMSEIYGNSTGILVQSGRSQITNNLIHNNTSVGLDVEFNAVSPDIRSNSFYCNSNADFFTNNASRIDIRNNAWDNDLVTNPTSSYGPTEMISFNGPFGCGGGIDICYQDTSPQPNFSTINPAVPNGCRFLP